MIATASDTVGGYPCRFWSSPVDSGTSWQVHLNLTLIPMLYERSTLQLTRWQDEGEKFPLSNETGLSTQPELGNTALTGLVDTVKAWLYSVCTDDGYLRL